MHGGEQGWRQDRCAHIGCSCLAPLRVTQQNWGPMAADIMRHHLAFVVAILTVLAF